jgi:hypothetical protein
MNYENFKQEVKENYPLRTVMGISSLKLDLNEGSYGTLEIQGRKIELLKSAFQSLIKTMGITNNFIEKFGKLFGQGLKNKLVDVLTKKLDAEKNEKLAVYIHPKLLKVVAITNPTSPYVSPDFYFDTVENVLTNNQLDVSNMSINNTGDISISTLNKEWGFAVDGMSDEDFNTGVIITTGPTESLSVNPHILRLICKNGMTAPRRLNMGPALLDSSPESVQKFMTELNSIKETDRQFKSVFTDQVKKMDSLYASFNEVHQLRQMVERVVTDVEDSRTLGILERFFPTGQYTNEYLTTKNINLDKLSQRHWRNAKTDMTVWELLNSLTDVASHDYGMGVGELAKNSLKREAGKFMFKKEFDTEFLIS